jgi:hypothetical protein
MKHLCTYSISRRSRIPLTSPAACDMATAGHTVAAETESVSLHARHTHKAGTRAQQALTPSLPPTAVPTARQLLTRAAYRGPYGNPLIPDPESLQGLTPAALRGFVADTFRPSHMVRLAMGAMTGG